MLQRWLRQACSPQQQEEAVLEDAVRNADDTCPNQTLSHPGGGAAALSLAAGEALPEPLEVADAHLLRRDEMRHEGIEGVVRDEWGKVADGPLRTRGRHPVTPGRL